MKLVNCETHNTDYMLQELYRSGAHMCYKQLFRYFGSCYDDDDDNSIV